MEDTLVMLTFVIVMLIVPVLAAWSTSAEDSRPAHHRPHRPSASSHLFSSPVERGFWLWTGVVLLVIYSTLGSVGGLADALREGSLLGLSLLAALLVVALPIAWRWAKTRPGLPEIGVALGVTSVYFAALLRMASWEERTHLFEYGLVAVLIYQALIERRRNGRRVPAPEILAVTSAALLGLLDEGIQWLLPNRVFDIVDVGFNALAAFLPIAAIWLISLVRRWRRKPR